MNEILTQTEVQYLPTIVETAEVRLTKEILAEWDLVFQGRMPPRRSVLMQFGIQKDQEESGLDLIENISDRSGTDPLDQLMDEELQMQLNGFIDKLFSGLCDEDWNIISLFLIDNLRVSEIVRILGTGEPADFSKRIKKTPVTSKSWKHVNKRILFFMNKLKQQVESIQLNYEDRDSVSQFCIYLIAKKIQKK